MKAHLTIALLSVLVCLAFRVSIGGFDKPVHFPEPVYNFSENPLTPEGIALGRALFYDPLLSADGTISCNSCHSPYNAFAHTDHDLSHGIGDSIGRRNAPALFNLAWQNSFNWDGAINHLDMQALAPINDLREMGSTTGGLLARLRNEPLYQQLFSKAFGDTAISTARMLKALAQFQLTLVSADSKYDQVKAGKAAFSSQEEKGYALFQANCNSCHTEPLFSTYTFAANGLSIDTSLKDLGRYDLSGLTADSLHFKIPSLRNLSFTPPYMHDGRFRSLGQILKHYSNQPGFALSSNDRADLAAFLLTLNDKNFVFNKNHHFPREILLERMLERASERQATGLEGSANNFKSRP